METTVLSRAIHVSVEKKPFRKKKWETKMFTVVHLKEVVELKTKVSVNENINFKIKVVVVKKWE